MARYPRRFGSAAARAQSRAAFTALGGFLPVLGAALSSVIESNAVTLSGLVGSSALTISGGQYSKNGAAYSSAATTVTNGDTLKLRVTSSATAGETASVVATIDGSSRVFAVTTAAATGTPTPTPTPTPTTTNIIVTNRIDYPNTSVSLNTNNTARREHFAAAAGAITDLRPIFKWNFFNGTTTGSGAAASLQHYLEYPEGVLHPVKWNGSDILTTAANGDYIADVVYSSVGNGPPLEIPAGAKYWEQTTYISNSSRVFPAISHAAAPATLGISDGKVAGGAGGTIPPDTSSLISWGMAAMMGTIKAANAVAYISIVDSLGIGQADTTGVGAKSSSGMIARAIDPLYPHARVGRGGYAAQDFVTMLGGVSFPNFFGNIRATHLLVEVGLNDLSLNSRTAAQVMADRQTIIDIITSKIPGIIPVHTTLTPRVDTTDNYNSLAGQTPKTDGNMADLNPFNALVRAKPKFMDYADAAMSARDSKIFGGPFPCSNDPTHMNTQKITDVASKVSVPT